MLWIDTGREKMGKRTSRQRAALWLQTPYLFCFRPLGYGKGGWEQLGWKGRREMAKSGCTVQRSEGTHGQCSWNGCGVGPEHRTKLHWAEDVQPVAEILLGLVDPFYYSFWYL